ncbi:MAG: DUF4153 domain-containing protein [Alphaproteobacteria bacterium]|nr:DUF4153 domain-containing protein [Alphaproteobacteria bacterium]
MTEDRGAEDQPIPRRQLLTFAALGLVQGVVFVILLLDVATSFAGADVAAAARLFAVMAPVLYMLSAQNGRWRESAVYAVVVALPVALLYLWAEFRFGPSKAEDVLFPAIFGAVIVAAVTLTLFQRWLAEHRLRFPYPAFFDHACRNVIAVAAGGLFVGVAWLLLWLWASLFDLVNIAFFEDLFGSAWFALPFSGLTAGLSLAILRRHARILQSIHDLSLALFAMLAPVLAVAAILFLAVLPFTGLAPLWDTGHATGVLLTVAFGAVFLVNAGIRGGDGGAPARPMTILLGIHLLLAPVFAGLAVYATTLRVGQYGLTPDRVHALVFAGCAGIWTVAYAYAVVRWRHAWADAVRRYNPILGIATAMLALGVMTPLLDPYGLSARTQVGRLVTGRVAPDQFDFGLLKYKLGMRGRAALARIRAEGALSKRAAIDRQLAALDKTTNYWHWKRHMTQQRDLGGSPEEIFNSLIRWPADVVAEQGFRDYLMSSKRRLLAGCLKKGQDKCALIAAELTGDSITEYVIMRRYSRHSTRFYAFRRHGTVWSEYDQWNLGGTDGASAWDAVKKGAVVVVAPRHRMLRLGDRVIPLAPRR